MCKNNLAAETELESYRFMLIKVLLPSINSNIWNESINKNFQIILKDHSMKYTN